MKAHFHFVGRRKAREKLFCQNETGVAKKK
jgi:hypothetical protein